MNKTKEDFLRDYDGPDKVMPVSQIKKALGEAPPPSVCLPTGLPCLSKYIHEFEGGELVTLSGPTGNGKTLLAQTLTNSFSEAKKWGVWFSYEVAPQQFIQQFGDELPYFYMPQELNESGLKWIEDRILESKLKYMCEYAIIDHLHYLVPMQSLSNMSIVIGGVCRELKKLALRHNMTIFLIAHTTKVQADEEPNLSNIRDSSFIGQESDTVLMVWRKGGDNEAVCKIAKNRRYGIMGKKVYLKKEGNYLVDDFIANEGSE